MIDTKILYKIFLVFFPILFLASCGDGSSSSEDTTSSSSDTNSSTYKITGTVPGTIIEAYCNDGSYYKTTSTNDGTSKHPFSLELPINVDCKLVMITNETASDPNDYIITPLTFSVNSNDGTYLTINKDVNLGYVPLETSSARGVQSALSISLSNVDIKKLTNDSMDSDNDGILNVYEDDDGDGISNKYDDDDDNDGIKDVNEQNDDKDNDGIKDKYDHDDDNDGISDDKDSDDDGDGVEDSSDSDHDDDDEYKPSTSTVSLATSYTKNDGRLLGSQCAQCHGTNGKSSSSFDSIIGEDDLAEEFYEDEDEIMSAQAHGYTTTEVNSIASWLKTLKD